MNSGFEIRGWGLCNVQQDVAFDEAYVMKMLEEAVRCDINYVELLGPYYNQPERCPIDSLITYREFPLLNQSVSMKRDLEAVKVENEKFNRICSIAAQRGISVTVWSHELWFPKDISAFYPAMADEQGNVVYSSEAFQQFLRSKYEELFETLPDLSGVVLTTCESLAMNILNLASLRDKHLGKYEAYVHLINTIAEICERYDRSLYVRMFGFFRESNFERVVDAFKKVHPSVRIHQKTCDHGDWQNPFQKANDRHGAFVGRFELAEEELGQEYFGLGDFPVVYPEVLRHRVDNCRAGGVRGMVARVDRWQGTRQNRVWEHEGQLNIVAFSVLAANPAADLSKTIWEWAEDYFGTACPYALKSLEQGAWIFYGLNYTYPCEDNLYKYRRGAWAPFPITMMDDQHGIFGAVREAGGYRTPMELALVRCERVIGDLNIGRSRLPQCTPLQRRHYETLYAKFQALLQFGQERMAKLAAVDAFGKLLANHYDVVQNRQRFLEAVDRFEHTFDPQRKDQAVKAMFTMLQAAEKLDIDTCGGYRNAGEL